MSRTSVLLLAITIGLVTATEECRAQGVGFGALQTWVNSGGSMTVTPVVTNNRRYVRMGMSVGISELVDVYTFSPVRGYSGLTPGNPIGFGFGGNGFNPGLNQGFDRATRAKNLFIGPKPTDSQFVAGAWKFDSDKNARLNKNELEKLASAVVTELKRTPAVYSKLKRGAESTKAGKFITQKDVTAAFLKQCLKYDRDKDGALNPHETEVMAAALVRFLK